MTDDQQPDPRLGLATTRQLLDEIRTRIEIDRYRGGGGLDYRTVDEESGHIAVIRLLFDDDRDTDPELVQMLQGMGETWGPLGVARSAAHLVWPELFPREMVIRSGRRPGPDD